MWGSYLHSSQNDLKSIDGVDKLLDILVKHPKLKNKIVIGLDQPWGDEFDAMRKVRNRFASLVPDDFISPYPADDQWKKGNDFMFSKLNGTVSLIETASKVCPEQRCNLLNYKDDDHLRASYTESKAVWIDQVFDGL